MTRRRGARAEVAQMEGAVALPRKSGEMVFHDDWERHAFAMAVSLANQGIFAWNEFQQELIESIAEAEAGNALNPSRGYYESWLVALERTLAKKKLMSDE